MNTHLPRLLERYPVLTACADDLRAAVVLLGEVFAVGNKLLICGNGGSAADSEHIVGEMMKGFLKARPIASAEAERLQQVSGTHGATLAARLQGALPAIALTSHLALNTAVANDTHGDMVFAQQVFGLGQSGDALLGISTSGNSLNVIHAQVVARARGLKTVALTGRSGGAMLPFADVAIRVPAGTVVEIQELHLPVYHFLCMELEERFF